MESEFTVLATAACRFCVRGCSSGLLGEVEKEWALPEMVRGDETGGSGGI
jgi:hypothetical protein